MSVPEAPIEFGAKHRLSIFAIFLLVVFSVGAALDLDTASVITLATRNVVTGYFDWLLVATVSAALIVAIGLACHPAASKKIGQATDVPEFSR